MEVCVLKAVNFLTPNSLTLILAYLAYYRPNFLSGRCLSATHLRELSQLLGHTQPDLRSVRAHPLLAIHLAVAHAVGLLSVFQGQWQTTLATLPWLEGNWQEQIASLEQALADSPQWSESLSTLGLQEVLTLDFLAFIKQQLSRQRQNPQPATTNATWLAKTSEAEWRIALPGHVVPNLLFHLWQMGNMGKDGIWQGTPYSIAKAAQRGYSLTLMESVLTRLTNEPLSDQQQNDLVSWYKRHDTYQIRPANLLSVKKPEQLDEIMSQQRWRPHIGERLSPRHAMVTSGLVLLLSRRLKLDGYPLHAPFLQSASEDADHAVDAATCWLALEVLQGLGKIIELPFSVSAEAHYQLETHLSSSQQADLTLKASQVLAGVKQAIRGRDAYFLPENAPDPALAAAIETTIAQEGTIEIAYQALGEASPRLRQVEPHWLERRETGIYLHGYCYLAEANRIFRLDRIYSWQEIVKPT